MPVKDNLVSSGLKIPHIGNFQSLNFCQRWFSSIEVKSLPPSGFASGSRTLERRQEDRFLVSMLSFESLPTFIKMLKCIEVWQLLVFWVTMPLTASSQSTLHLIYLCPQVFHTLPMGQMETSRSLAAILWPWVTGMAILVHLSRYLPLLFLLVAAQCWTEIFFKRLAISLGIPRMARY